MKRLLSNTLREMFGINREFSSLEVVLFYFLVVVTTLLAFFFITP